MSQETCLAYKFHFFGDGEDEMVTQLKSIFFWWNRFIRSFN
ncbi:hypothetical protein [Bacillus sp. AK128]